MAGRREQLVGLGRRRRARPRLFLAGRMGPAGDRSPGGAVARLPAVHGGRTPVMLGNPPHLRGQLASEGVHIRSLGGAYSNFDL